MEPEVYTAGWCEPGDRFIAIRDAWNGFISAPKGVFGVETQNRQSLLAGIDAFGAWS